MKQARAQINTGMLSRLRADEQLLWSGQPRGGFRFTGADLLLVPFALFWCLAALDWWQTARSSALPSLFGMLVAPLAAVGVYLLAGRFFVDRWQRSRTVYAVTDQRLIAVHGPKLHSVESLGLEDATHIEARCRADGSGTIRFIDRSMPYAAIHGAWWPGLRQLAGFVFEDIPDAESVRALIVEARRARVREQ